jgi:hypothetical protein
VTHECRQDADCAGDGVRAVEDYWTHHRAAQGRKQKRGACPVSTIKETVSRSASAKLAAVLIDKDCRDAKCSAN